MDDEGDGGAELAARGDLGEEAFVGGFPELQVGEVLVVDDDQEIEVGEVAADGIMDPVSPTGSSSGKCVTAPPPWRR